MSETINLTDELRIRRLDERNVVVEKHFKRKDGGREWDQYNRNGRGPFFADVAGACSWVLKHGLLEGDGETDLQGAVKEFRAVAARLEKAVKAAMPDA